MWRGRWNRNLCMLYDAYIDIFDIEPDCYEEINYDDLSYNSFVKCLKKSVVSFMPFPDAVRKTIPGFKLGK